MSSHFEEEELFEVEVDGENAESLIAGEGITSAVLREGIDSDGLPLLDWAEELLLLSHEPMRRDMLEMQRALQVGYFGDLPESWRVRAFFRFFHCWASLVSQQHAVEVAVHYDWLVSPTGKLPVTFPQSEADTIAPDSAAEVVYSEGLKTSYRAPGYDPAYPFGHGLSYSNFTYTALAPTACVDPAYKACLGANVTNVGVMAAAVVTQLYATFPAEAAQPSALLRGFAKSPTLAPGASAPLVFGLTTRDLSFWSEACPSGWCELDSAQLTFTLRESSAEASVRATLRASR